MKSKLIISCKQSNGKTQLDRYFATPPFKVMTLPNQPHDWANSLTAMQMSASPGLLAGDKIEIELSLAPHCALNLTTQAFTRVQAMHEGDKAEQHTHIQLAAHSRLFYLPHPLVLHKDSCLQQRTEIALAEGCQLIYGEIVAIGRVLNGERFAFRQFSSHLQIWNENRPLVVDNIQWQPAKMSLASLGQMEQFSHQGSLVLLDLNQVATFWKAVVSNWQAENDIDPDCLVGISQLQAGGLMIRCLAHRADQIQALFERYATLFKAVCS